MGDASRGRAGCTQAGLAHLCSAWAWRLSGFLEAQREAVLGPLGHLPQPSLPFLGISTCQRGYPGATPGLSRPLRSHSPPKGSLIVPGMGNCPKSSGEKAEAGEKEGGFTLSHQSSRGVCISSLLTHLGKVPGFTPSSETQGWACARELGAGGHLTEGGQGLQAAKEASYRLGPSSCSQLWTLT